MWRLSRQASRCRQFRTRRTREARKADLHARLEHLDGIARAPKLDKATLLRDLGQRLTDWQGLLGAEPGKARQIMRQILVGRIVFEPDPKKGLYTFTVQPAYDRLLTGLVHNAWCPRGDSRVRYSVLLRRLTLPFNGRLTVQRRHRAA